MNKEGFHGETIFRKKTDNQGEALRRQSTESVQSTGPRRLFLGCEGRGAAGRESALLLELS